MIHHTFAFLRAPWGSMAEQAPVALNHCIALPDGLDSVTAAAMANPGTSAWAARENSLYKSLIILEPEKSL